MKAMVLQRHGEPLTLMDRPDPQPISTEVRVRVAACGVCRTDLHVVEVGRDVNAIRVGMRVGIPWLGYTCGHCYYCLENRENLCDHPLFTGYTRDGGYATHVVADARYVCPLPDHGDDVATASILPVIAAPFGTSSLTPVFGFLVRGRHRLNALGESILVVDIASVDHSSRRTLYEIVQSY